MRQTWSKEVKEWARRVFRYDGLTTYEIAEITGCSQSAAFRWVNPVSSKRFELWGLKNPEKLTQINKRQALKPSRMADDRENSARRRARKRVNYEDQPLLVRQEIRQFYRDCPPGFEVDHLIPLACGGTHTMDNLQYLPKYLNRHKSNQLISNHDLVQKYG